MIDRMKIEATFADMIDDRIEMYGVRNTISYLLERGFTEQDLLDLRFDEDDVKYVIENPDEEYSI